MFRSIYRDHDEDAHEEFKEKWLVPTPGPNFQFEQPLLTIHPKEFVDTHFGANCKMKTLQFRKGTTTLAFKYEPLTAEDNGGIVIAVDSRASAGEYISSRTVMKIIHIGDSMVTTMAGGAADCQFWSRVVRNFVELEKLREGEPPSVKAVSKFYASTLYQYRGMGLQVGSMIVGVDRSGPRIFQVNSSGARSEQQWLSIGSGMFSAHAILDTYFTEKPTGEKGMPMMTDEEALKLGSRAIMHATYRDGGSGGHCNMVYIAMDGKKKTFAPIDVSRLYEEYIHEGGHETVYEPRDD